MRLQDLSPSSAHLCLEIEKICKTHLAQLQAKKILLAVSGGADSVALTWIFHILAPRLQLSLAAAHINHSLRENAGLDAEFTKDFCADLGIPCKIMITDARKYATANKIGLEEAGRDLRRRLLEQTRQELGANYIVLAHHADDLAEDILMRLLRGAGWPALGGMSWLNGIYARPLLHTRSKKLKDFLVSLSQPWQEDESNQSLEFRRNRMRHVVLPILQVENPNIEAGLCRLQELAEIDRKYWNDLIDKELAKNPLQILSGKGKITILLPAKLLKALQAAARLRLYQRVLNDLRSGDANSGQNRYDTLLALERCFIAGIGGKRILCSGGIVALCCKEGILFEKKIAAPIA